MLRQLCNNTLSKAWSWWWQTSNSRDEYALWILNSTICVFFFAWFAKIYTKKSKNCKPLLPAGPKGLPLIGNLLSLEPELHKYFFKMSQIYGPIFSLRLGKKFAVVITSPALARQVLKDQDATFANHDVPEAAKEVTYGGTDIVWTPYGPEWRMLRRVCASQMLNSAVLDEVYKHRRKEIRQTVNYFYNQAGSPINFGEQMFLTVFNVITNMLWGGIIEGGERERLGAEFKQLVAEITALLGMPNISDFYPSLARFDLQGIQKKMRRLALKFDGIFENMINERLQINGQGGKVSKDFLQVLLELKNEENSKVPFTMSHLKGLLMDMVVGGTDTTSNTMEFAMAEVMNKPEILRKLQQELELVVGKGNTVEESHVTKLPYLYAVMKETLRLHPVVPLLVPHRPTQTSMVGGYVIPEGSRVFFNVWAIQRDEKSWDKPLEFCPERFLNLKIDHYSGNEFNYFPFGSGRRVCAGVAMAEKMFMFLMASLIHSFEWKLPQEGVIDLTEKFGIVLKKKVPLVAIPIPRSSVLAFYQ